MPTTTLSRHSHDHSGMPISKIATLGKKTRPIRAQDSIALGHVWIFLDVQGRQYLCIPEWDVAQTPYTPPPIMREAYTAQGKAHGSCQPSSQERNQASRSGISTFWIWLPPHILHTHTYGARMLQYPVVQLVHFAFAFAFVLFSF